MQSVWEKDILWGRWSVLIRKGFPCTWSSTQAQEEVGEFTLVSLVRWTLGMFDLCIPVLWSKLVVVRKETLRTEAIPCLNVTETRNVSITKCQAVLKSATGGCTNSWNRRRSLSPTPKALPFIKPKAYSVRAQTVTVQYVCSYHFCMQGCINSVRQRILES